MSLVPWFFALLVALATTASLVILGSFLPLAPRRPSGKGRTPLPLFLVPLMALLVVATASLLPGPVPLVLVVGGGSFFAARWVGRRRTRRIDRERCRRELPTLVDALVLNVEAGHSLLPAFMEAREVLDPSGPLARGIGWLENDLRLGLPQAEAFARLKDRLPGPEVEAFLAGLILALELGTPIARVLREQGARMREHLLLEGERFANTLSLKLLGPLFLFIFPAAFLLILSPVLIALLENRPW